MVLPNFPSTLTIFVLPNPEGEVPYGEVPDCNATSQCEAGNTRLNAVKENFQD